MRGDSTKCKLETWGSGNVTDYALNAGPGVNETSDEKRNLPSSIISTANSLCSTAFPPLWVFPQGCSDWCIRKRRGTRLKRWWVFNLFNIYMSYSGLTWALSIWNCLWPRPASLEDPRQCLSYQNLFSSWPCGPASYLNSLSPGLKENVVINEQLLRLVWTWRDFTFLLFLAEAAKG